MKKLKIYLAIVIMVTLIVTALSGCNPSSDKEENLKLIKAWSSNVHSESAVQDYVAKMNDTVLKQKGIKLEYETYGNDYGKTLDMAIANDQAPELFSGAIGTYANKKQIKAIEDLPGGKDILNMYPENVAASDYYLVPGEPKPKIYSLICNYTTVGMVYNKDLFKKAGIVDANGNAKPPETFAELREDAKKLTNPDKQEYGIIMPFKWAAYAGNELIAPFGPSQKYGTYNINTGEYDYSVNKPDLEWWLGIKEDKTFYPGPEGIDNDPARAKFSEGKVGMKFAASYDVSVYNDMFPAQCDWGVAPFPVLDKNKPKYMQGLQTSSFLNASALAKDDKIPALVECLKLMYAPELHQLLYERGMNIPVSKLALEKATNVSTKKGWKEFGEMAKISYKSPKMTPTLKMEGETDQATYMKVWSGIMTIDEALADLTKRSNEAFKKGVERGDIPTSLYVDPNYDRNQKPTQPPLPDCLKYND